MGRTSLSNEGDGSLGGSSAKASKQKLPTHKQTANQQTTQRWIVGAGGREWNKWDTGKRDTSKQETAGTRQVRIPILAYERMLCLNLPQRKGTGQPLKPGPPIKTKNFAFFRILFRGFEPVLRIYSVEANTPTCVAMPLIPIREFVAPESCGCSARIELTCGIFFHLLGG